MATVYLARDLKHDRDVAIKVLRPELAAVIGAERFLAEIKTTANLQHPHILPLHDSGEINGTVFYVMPFIEGESLRDRLSREKQLPIAEAVRIATEVASALDYAHRHGVIHRDIKPENILLHDGQALVADFGIALAVSKSDGSTRMTETGMSLGTPHYMSPEQAMGERDLDARTDVYALGCVAYEMLVGEPPFSGPTAQAIVAKVMTATPAPITDTRKTVPPAVEDAVHTALQKLPADRFASAAEFSAALAGSGTGTRHATAARRVAPADRRALFGLGALAAVLGVLAILGWMRGTDGGGDDAPLAYQIHLTPSEANAGFVANQLSVSADGSVIVFSDTVGGTRQLWVKERGVVEPRPIPGTVGGRAPFLSPDGRSVAYRVAAQLLRIPLAGGAPQILSDSAMLEVGVDSRSVRGAWLDNGTIVFLGGLSRFLYAVAESGGPLQRVATTDQLFGFPATIAAVPGHDAVVVTVCDYGTCTSPILNLVRIGARSVERILPGSAGAWPLRDDRILNVLPDGTMFLASFDPESGTIGEGEQIAAGITVGSHGPELSVGVAGVTVTGVGGVGSFSSRTRLELVGWDGTTRVIDSAWSPVFANNSRIEVSPDGRRLLFSEVDPDGIEVSLYVKPYPTGPATRFSAMGTQSARGVWAPDGQRIAWVMVGDDGNAQIWQQAADGSGAPTLLVSDPRGVFEVNFSPNGEWVLYRTDDVSDGNGDIYARRLSGDTTAIPVATSDAEETSPAISPDGRWIAYAERIGFAKEVIVRPFPDVDAGRVQVSNGGGTEPLWSRDGQTLYYRDPGRGQMITATPPFSGGGRRMVFQAPVLEYWDNDDTRQYTLAPDGSGLLMMRRLLSSTASGGMRLILRERIIPPEDGP